MINRKSNVQIQGSRELKILMDLTWNDEFQDKPVIIFCHGYKGFKDWGPWNIVAEYFANLGFVFLKFNFSFNGGTVENPIDFPDLDAFSKNNYSTELNDLEKVLNWCDDSRAQGNSPIESSEYYLLGHSRGGAMTILKTAEDSRVKKLVTWAAVADLGIRFSNQQQLEKWKSEGVIYVENSRTRQSMPHLYQFYEDYCLNEKRLNPLLASESISVPWLIVHAEDDESVPVEQAIQLSAHHHDAELLLLEIGGHTFDTFHPMNTSTLPNTLKQVCASTATFLFGEI